VALLGEAPEAMAAATAAEAKVAAAAEGSVVAARVVAMGAVVGEAAEGVGA